MDEWINVWHTHVMEYYLTTERNEVLMYATLMNFENIKLGEHKRPHIVCFHLNEKSRIGNSIEIESRLTMACG